MRFFLSLGLRYGLALSMVLLQSVFLWILFPLTFFTTLFLTSPFTSVTTLGHQLIIGSASFDFVAACVASLAYILLAVLLLLTPGLSTSQRFLAFFFGSFLIFVLNIFRIELLIFIFLTFGKDYFTLVHLTFWNFVSSIFVAVVWFFLVKRFEIQQTPFLSDVQAILQLLRKR